MTTTSMVSTEETYELVRSALAELFKIDPARVGPQTNLFEELKIDSIDAVDLILHVERAIGKKIGADEFHAVRTVSDLVAAISRLQQA